MFKRMIRWLDSKIEETNKWWIPPVRRFAENNPRTWRLFVALLVAAPFGVALFILFNAILWLPFAIGGWLTA